MGFDYRTDAGMGKQTLGGHKKNLVCTRIQEKGAVTPQKTERDLPVSVWESVVACHGVRSTDSNSPGRHGVLA